MLLFLRNLLIRQLKKIKIKKNPILSYNLPVVAQWYLREKKWIGETPLWIHSIYLFNPSATIDTERRYTETFVSKLNANLTQRQRLQGKFSQVCVADVKLISRKAKNEIRHVTVLWSPIHHAIFTRLWCQADGPHLCLTVQQPDRSAQLIVWIFSLLWSVWSDSSVNLHDGLEAVKKNIDKLRDCINCSLTKN